MDGKQKSKYLNELQDAELTTRGLLNFCFVKCTHVGKGVIWDTVGCLWNIKRQRSNGETEEVRTDPYIRQPVGCVPNHIHDALDQVSNLIQNRPLRVQGFVPTEQKPNRSLMKAELS